MFTEPLLLPLPLLPPLLPPLLLLDVASPPSPLPPPPSWLLLPQAMNELPLPKATSTATQTASALRRRTMRRIQRTKRSSHAKY